MWNAAGSVADANVWCAGARGCRRVTRQIRSVLYTLSKFDYYRRRCTGELTAGQWICGPPGAPQWGGMTLKGQVEEMALDRLAADEGLGGAGPAHVALQGRLVGRPSRARAKEIPSLILKAAMAEFSEKGFGAATIAGIASRAGVSRMTVYKHAESKEQLLEKLSQFTAERFRASVARAIDESLPCWEVLMAVGRCFYSYAQDDDSLAISRILVDEAAHLPHRANRGVHLRKVALQPLSAYLGRLAFEGVLMIDRPEFSAEQFLNLTTASVDFLFGDDQLTADEREHYLAAAVKTFLYGVALGRRDNGGMRN